MYDIAGGAQVAINEPSDADKELTDMRSAAALVFSALPPGREVGSDEREETTQGVSIEKDVFEI
jgi:hypothetical protein